MDLRRLRVGEWLVGAAGALLLLSLFLPWFDQRVQCGQTPCPPIEENGWESFAVTDLLLAAVALGALVLLAITAHFRSASPAIAYEALLTLFAAAALVALGLRLLSPPGDVVGRGLGAWLGLLAAAGIVAASLVAMRDERLSRPGRLTDPSGAPVSAPREVETLPAPPATS